jgi:hypothetical protein
MDLGASETRKVSLHHLNLKNPKIVVLPSMTCDLVVSIRILEALSCAICQAFGDCEAKGSKGL